MALLNSIAPFPAGIWVVKQRFSPTYGEKRCLKTNAGWEKPYALLTCFQFKEACTITDHVIYLRKTISLVKVLIQLIRPSPAFIFFFAPFINFFIY